MLDYNVYIREILESINKIEKTTERKNDSEIVEDINLWDATLMRLQIIGENIKKIPFELKKKNKDIKWRRWAKLRNLISHKYSEVEENTILDLIKNKLPEFKKQIITLKE